MEMGRFLWDRHGIPWRVWDHQPVKKEWLSIFCHICILNEYDSPRILRYMSVICPKKSKADHVTKFQLQSSVAQRVGTCIVYFCLNSKPRAVHTIEACIYQYGSFLKWVYPKSSWVSMRKWFNEWMFWGHPYFRKPPYEWNSWDRFCFNHYHIQIQISLRKWPITVGIIGSLGSACWPKPYPFQIITGIQCQVTFSNLVSNMYKCCILYCRTTTTVVWDV